MFGIGLCIECNKEFEIVDRRFKRCEKCREPFDVDCIICGKTFKSTQKKKRCKDCRNSGLKTNRGAKPKYTQEEINQRMKEYYNKISTTPEFKQKRKERLEKQYEIKRKHCVVCGIELEKYGKKYCKPCFRKLMNQKSKDNYLKGKVVKKDGRKRKNS